MGSISLVTLCLLVLFNGCLGQLEQVTSRQAQEEAKRQQRYQMDECRIESLNALEPSRKIESENGVTEIWDENDQQFQCAGAVAIRHVINQDGLLLPSYSNGPKLIYVVQGSGLHGASLSGCPETYQSSRQGGSQTDQHQKVRQVRQGDVVAVPEGTAEWFYNNGDRHLVLVLIIDTSNSNNQLDQNHRTFFLAGNPQKELQSLRGESQYPEKERRPGIQWNAGNIFSGFDEKILAESFNINTELARRLQGRQDGRGNIIRVERGFAVISPERSQEEEERDWRRERDNGIEETLCTLRMKHNMNDPSHADVFNPRAGRITTINSLNLPILRYLRLSAQKGVLYRRAMFAPHWNINSHSVCYFTRGRGRVQIVGDNGQTVFDGEVREGQILTAPQNFATIKQASDEGLEWVAFKTNDQAQISLLAGRISVIRSMPEDVLANAYQISREDARRLKNNREEVTVLSPSRSRFD